MIFYGKTYFDPVYMQSKITASNFKHLNVPTRSKRMDASARAFLTDEQ